MPIFPPLLVPPADSAKETVFFTRPNILWDGFAPALQHLTHCTLVTGSGLIVGCVKSGGPPLPFIQFDFSPQILGAFLGDLGNRIRRVDVDTLSLRFGVF